MTKTEKAIVEYYVRYYHNTLGLPNWETLADARRHEEKEETKRADILEKMVGSVKNKRVLSVGCGTGGFCFVMADRGADIFGIEPDEDAIVICHAKAEERKTIPADRFIVGIGEKMPYEDNSFDIIQCYTVLEHVQDVTKTCHEMVRVLKPGGKIYIHSPNYLYPYEGHYKIGWLPLLPKFIGKLYLRARKRPPQFLSTINYLTPSRVERAFTSGGGSIAKRGSLTAHPTAKLDRAFARLTGSRVTPHIELVVEKKT